MPSPLEKRCFSSASQTGQPAFWQDVLAIHGAALLASTNPSLDILSSRSSGHRAQLGGARSAREAALRKRLPSPLEKRCFSSASQTGQPAFWQNVLAIHGAALLTSTNPGLDILSSRSALEKRCFSSASQTGQPAFWQNVLAIHGAALLTSTNPGLDILSSRSALEKRCFSSASQTGQPAFWQDVLAIHGAALLTSTNPSLDILSSRSALEKRCFSSASQTGPHPVSHAR